MTGGPIRILVVGAINQDDIARVALAPRPGETVVTDAIESTPGGKGANQAAAAAQAGRGVTVLLAGAVGEDAAGDAQLAALTAAGVDVALVRRLPDTSTGRALITVSADGENSIVVALGANAHVSPLDLSAVPDVRVVVGQTEVGADAIDTLARFAIEGESRLIINNGPVVALSKATLARADPLIVNEHEARGLLPPGGLPGAPQQVAAALMVALSPRSLVVTLGAAGCVVADGEGIRSVSARPVQAVVDTTGAGDTFVGSLAAALAVGLSLNSAVDAASSHAADAVGWRGARRPLGASISNR